MRSTQFANKYKCMNLCWSLGESVSKKIPADIQLYKHPSRLPLLRTVDERETNRVCPIRFIPLKYKWLNTILGENYVDMTLQTSLSKIINSRFYCALRDSLCSIRPRWPPCFLFKGNTRTLVDIKEKTFISLMIST